jgi:CheY-like chemotaxis protein
MPVLDGRAVAWQLSRDPMLKNVRIIICTGFPEHEDLSGLPPGNIPIVAKPFVFESLLAMVEEETP